MPLPLDLPVPGVTEGPLWAVKVNAAITALNGDTAQTHTQVSPLATWSFSHSMGRVPAVTIYVGGEAVEADVTATTTTVNISFPVPVAGIAVLN